MKDDFVVLSDLDNIKKAFENAEIEHEIVYDPCGVTKLETEDGIVFNFDDEGLFLGLEK